MSIYLTPAEMAQDRADVESAMTVTLTAYAYEWVTDDDLEIQSWIDQGSSKGKVGGVGKGDTAAQVVTIGGVEREIERGGLHLPLSKFTNSTDGLLIKPLRWKFAVTAVGALDDLGLLGRHYLVVNVPAKSHATARRLDVTLMDPAWVP